MVTEKEDLSSLAAAFQAVETGWGGPGIRKILCSPKDVGSLFDLARVIRIIVQKT